MKLTKYEHACLVLEEGGKKLVIDPGNLTHTFGQLNDIVAVVITHQHGDHCYPEHLKAILAANPDVQIFMPADAVAQYADVPNAIAITGGEEKLVHSFTLRFYGELHAQHHPTLPQVQNVGVMVNDTLYYPGDSFTPPDMRPRVLALPATAGWMKISEAVDFVAALQPEQYFVTHDGVVNETGRGNALGILQKTNRELGATLLDMNPGDTLEC